MRKLKVVFLNGRVDEFVFEKDNTFKNWMTLDLANTYTTINLDNVLYMSETTKESE